MSAYRLSMEARHIGYVLRRFPRSSETFVASELIELGRQGERVTIFAVGREDDSFRHAFLAELKANVVYLPGRPVREPLRVARALARVLRSDPRGWLRAAAVSLWPPRPGGSTRLLQATVLRDEMARAGVDHAHAHFATTAAPLANLAWRMGGPTYRVTAHAEDIYDRQLGADRLRERLEAATFVATATAASRDDLDAVLDGRVRLHVVANALDLRRLGPPRTRRPEANFVLAVARLVERKGLVDLVLAGGLLAARGVDLRVEIVGEGPLREGLEEMAAITQAPVTFRGALPQVEVLELYGRAAVFCLPCVVAPTGDRDGIPTSVMEAMALGVPVVTTAVNGLGELVANGRTGLVVPERDPCILADALALLLADPELAERLAENARMFVETAFSLEHSVSSLRSLFPDAA